MHDRKFIAAKRLRFGDGELAPGEPVPFEPGRRYDLMLDVGDIIEVTTQDVPNEVLFAVREGDVVVFVSETGELSTATFVLLTEPPEEALDALGLEPGERAPSLDFGDGKEVFVRPERVLPAQALQLLLAVRGAGVDAGNARVAQREAELQSVIRTVTQTAEELRVERDRAYEALNAPRPVVLPDGALEKLIAIKGVGEKLAREILDALYPPAPPAEPEG